MTFIDIPHIFLCNPIGFNILTTGIKHCDKVIQAQRFKKFLLQGDKKRNPTKAKHADKLSDILDIIDGASSLLDINYPGSGLHLLNPKEDKIWAVEISGPWRISFKFVDGDAYIIDYLNYH